MATATYLADPYLPVQLDDLTIAFPASVRALMPDPAVLSGDNPEHRNYCDFNDRSDWARFWSEAFFYGLAEFDLTPREGIDKAVAWRHLRCILGSFEPKHEHKEGALRFLSERWFSKVTWRKAERVSP